MSSAGNTVIGIIVSLSASALDAIGLNLMRKDHVANMQLPESQRRPDFKRKLWLLGLIFYVGSQLFGSTVALYFLQPVVVAPLGAASLIFNFIFAHFLVGSRIKRQDIIGTMLIITGAVFVAVFGDMPHVQLTLADLMALYNRAAFIIYFSILEIIVLLLVALGFYCKRLAEISVPQPLVAVTLATEIADLAINSTAAAAATTTKPSAIATTSASHTIVTSTALSTTTPPIIGAMRHPWIKHRPRIFRDTSDKRIRKLTGLFFASAGGMIASQTLLLAETGVRLISVSASGNNQFTSFQPFLIMLILLLTAVAQVFCMNTALRYASAVTVVPIFFAYYSVLGFFNSLVYFDRWFLYSALQYSMILTGIAVLVYGVRLISASQAQSQQQQQDAVNNTMAQEESISVNSPSPTGTAVAADGEGKSVKSLAGTSTNASTITTALDENQQAVAAEFISFQSSSIATQPPNNNHQGNNSIPLTVLGV